MLSQPHYTSWTSQSGSQIRTWALRVRSVRTPRAWASLTEEVCVFMVRRALLPAESCRWPDIQPSSPLLGVVISQGACSYSMGYLVGLLHISGVPCVGSLENSSHPGLPEYLHDPNDALLWVPLSVLWPGYGRLWVYS